MKTVVITGVTSGIGKAIAAGLKSAGWSVVGLTREQANLADPLKMAEVAEAIAKEHMTIDALIHVAGLWHGKSVVHANKDLEDFTPHQIVDTMNIGVTSFMVLASKLLPVVAREGAVIAISGTFADGATGWLPYYTSKRALEDFVVGLSQDYPHGPRVFGISPADTATPAFKKFYPEYADKAQQPETIATAIIKLIDGVEGEESGTILEIRDGEIKKGFHV